MTPTRAKWTAHLLPVAFALSAGCGGREALPVGPCAGQDAVVLGQEGSDFFAGVALDPDGNRIVAYLAATEPTMLGTVIHTQSSDGCMSSRLHRDLYADAFAVDPSGDYIVIGRIRGHGRTSFMKLDPLGQLTVAWAIDNTVSSGARSPFEIDFSPTGRVLVSAVGIPTETESSGMESAGASYIYIDAVDPTGRLAASVALPRPADPVGGSLRKAVIDLPNGNVLLLVTLGGTLELPNGPVSAAKGTLIAIELDDSLAVTKTHTIDAMDHVETAVADQDGAIYVAGSNDSARPNSDEQGQMVKLDAAMSVVWRSTLGPVVPSMLALDDAGQVHFVGARTDDHRTFVAGRLAADGEVLGTEPYLTHETAALRAGGAIAIDPLGRRVIAGQIDEGDVLHLGEGPLSSSGPDVYLGTLPAP